MRTLTGLAMAVAAMVVTPNATAQSSDAPACSYVPSTVYFDFDSDAITAEGQNILDNVASEYRMCGHAEAVISGHTDRMGDAGYNVGLSQRMAANVRNYLTGRGIPEGVMTVQAFGETRPQIDTEDGIREPQNRRVEITFGPGSGW